jgi:predicted deacylase
MSRQLVGTSTQGRPIYVHCTAAAQSGTRVLLVGGQHGDESLARAAVRGFLRTMRPASTTAGLQLAAIADLNPDGRALRTRLNAAGIDLNRDHQRLRAVETRALHQWVRSWRPDLIVDVHTYPPRRKHLLKQGWAYCHDVFLDLPTNPSLPAGVTGAPLLAGMNRVLAKLRQEDILADRYVLLRRSGRVRHSTADVVDARNQFALRYGIPVLLLEGKQPPRRSRTATWRRTRRAMIRALQHIVDWSATCGTDFGAQLPAEPADGLVALKCRYREAAAPARILMEEVDSGHLREVSPPGRYTPALRVTRRTQLPVAYAVPKAFKTLNELLAAHGFQYQPVVSDRTSPVSPSVRQYVIESCVPSRRPHRPARQVKLATQVYQETLQDHIIYPTDQTGGKCLAVLLEPNSKYGLTRYAEYGLSLHPGTAYPILRCEH